MGLDFVGINPGTPDGGCPAVFVDSRTGKLKLIATVVTDASEISEVREHSPIAEGEVLVEMAPDMFEFIREAIDGTYERGRRGPGPH